MITTLEVPDLVDFCFPLSLIKLQPIKTIEPSFRASDSNILKLFMNSDENTNDCDGNGDDDENVDVASIADNDEHEAAVGVHRPCHRPFLFPQHPQVHGGCHDFSEHPQVHGGCQKFSTSLGLELRNYTQIHGCSLAHFFKILK